ncbi:hypothetical protein D3C76_1675150 [compost metagenome]
MQLDFQPEHRGGIAGIEDLGPVRAKMLAERRRTDLRNAGIAIAVFEHLHHLPQRQAAGGVVEIDRRGQ